MKKNRQEILFIIDLMKDNDKLVLELKEDEYGIHFDIDTKRRHEDWYIIFDNRTNMFKVKEPDTTLLLDDEELIEYIEYMEEEK